MINTTKNKLVCTCLRLLKLSTVILSIALASTQAFAQAQSKAIPPLLIQAATPSVKCFDDVKIEASFIAFTTAKTSSLANWYQELFTLSTVKEFAFPDGKTTGILMNNDDLIVEVFFKKDVLIPEEQVPQSTAGQWQGVNKVGIFTNANLPALKQCLIKAGVNATRIWHDKNLAIDLLQIIDPDGNLLEIITRKA